MKSTLLLPYLLILTLNINAQVLSTSKYAGIYMCNIDTIRGSGEIITIYPETDSTILFYIDICLGEPSYNLGSLYNRVIIKDSQGLFYSNQFSYQNEGCKWLFAFSNDTLKIRTIDNQYECGFGNGIIADGEYIRESSTIPEFFENGESIKIYFKITPPEKYYN